VVSRVYNSAHYLCSIDPGFNKTALSSFKTMSTSQSSMSSSSVPSAIPSYCKDYKGHDGTITRLSKENKDIYDKMFSIAGYCPPGKEGCTSQRPRQNGGPPCASWIVYLILCLVPGGHATCDAMLHMARELFPDASIKNQTLRSALCKKPEFYNIHTHQVWRLRNRNEPVPAKRPGGVKPMIERCEGKGTPAINKGKRKAQQYEFDDDDDEDDEMEDEYLPPRSPTEEPVPKKSKVEGPVTKTTSGRKPLPANRCSSVSINSEPLQPILLGPAQDSVETINKPSGYKLIFPRESVEAWRKNRAQEVENGNGFNTNDGRPKRTRTMTPKAMDIQKSRKAYKEPNNITNIKENKKCGEDSAETKKISVAGSKCRVNSHSSKVTTFHASQIPKLRYKPQSQPSPPAASRSLQQPFVPTAWKAPAEFRDKFYHLRTQESSGIPTPSPPKPAVMWTAWGPRIAVMDTKTNFDYGQELTVSIPSFENFS